MRTHLRLFLGCLALVLVTTFAKAQWSEIPPLPVTVSWPMTAEAGGKIYAFGGLASTGSREAYSYTPGAADWVKIPALMPKGKWGGYAATVNGKIYIVGGLIVSGQSAAVNAETYEFDPVTETFTTKKALTTATRSGYFAGATVGGKIYMIGGTNNGSSDITAIQIYDPATDTWTTSTSKQPYTGRYVASAVLNGKIFLMGGNSTQAYLTQAWKGTPNDADGTIAWEKVADLPAALTRGSAGVSNGEIVFAGGAPTLTEGYANTYIYNETNDVWETSYGFPVPTYNGGQLFGPNNDLYYVGGYQNTQSFKFNNNGSENPAAIVNAKPIFHNLAAGNAAISSFTVQNLGVVPLTVSFTIPGTASAWLTSSQMNGTVDALATESFNINLFAGTLAPGAYKADVVITTNDPVGTPTTLPVMLYVLPEGINAQPTRVVVEEGTGDWCQYCPDGHRVLGELHDAFEENIIVLSYHGGSGSEPMMITDGQNLINILGIPGYPAAAINRLMFDGEDVQMVYRNTWLDYVQQVLDNQPKAAANITVLSQSYDAATNMFKAKVEIELNEAVPDAEGALRLTTVVTEDGLDYGQTDVGGVRYDTYEHNEVVRNVYPDEYGMVLEVPPGSVSEGLIAPRTKITKEIEFDVNADITRAGWDLKNPANSFVTFLVHGVDGTSLTKILHAAQVPLTANMGAVQTSPVATTVAVSNYPNPVAKSATFTYSVTEPSVVSLAVYDVMGREVATVVSNEQHSVGTFEAAFNASNLLNGTYTVVLTAGAHKATGTMIVQK